ncbi:MAG: hypothetical protein HUU38_10925 [Anaerolineales bacterium]|nr:hypothetical protein [Anaerolineales bacterium]
MARQRRTSPTVENALTRSASLESIDSALDLGSGLTLTAYRSKITDVQAKLTAYNAKLAETDALLNALKAGEKELNTLSARMLAGVGVKYGKDSNEYEQAGGTRTSEITRSPRSRGTIEPSG